jgi:hypothetical protein
MGEWTVSAILKKLLLVMLALACGAAMAGAPISGPPDALNPTDTEQIPGVHSGVTVARTVNQRARGVQNAITATTADKARTPAEISARVVPVNYFYLPGDLRRYGAVCNGSTSGSADTAAIQAADTIPGPLTISFPGMCISSITFNVLSNVVLQGSGASTGLKYTGGSRTSSNAINFASGVTNAGVQNMAVIGPGVLTGYSITGIYFAAGSSYDFAKNVTVTGFPGIGSFGSPGIGIGMLGAHESVSDSDIENNQYGVGVSGTFDRLVNSYISNHFSTNGTPPWTSAQPLYDGVEVGGSDHVISGNVITDNGQSGIYLGGNGYISQRVSITNNVISYNWNNGLDMGLQTRRSRTNDVIGITSTGNVGYNNRHNNFWMAGVADSTLTGNTGIYDANYASWRGFSSYPGTHNNIGLYDGAAGSPMIGDTITGNTTADNLGKVGISFSYATTAPTGVTISGNAVDSSYYIYNGNAYINNFIDAAHVESFTPTTVGWTGQSIASCACGVRFAGKKAEYSLVMVLGTASSPSGNFVLGLPYVTSMALEYSSFHVEAYSGWNTTLASDMLSAYISSPGSGQIEVGRMHSGSLKSDAVGFTANSSAITIKGSVSF